MLVTRKINSMKRTYINLMGIAFNALLCLFLALPASAQRQNNGGGGNSGGGNNGGGGGSRPAVSSGGGAQSAPRPSYNGGGAQRMGTTAPQRTNSIGPQQRGNVAVAPGNVSRQAVPRQGISPGQRGVSATVQMGLAARPAYRSYPGLPGSPGFTPITTGRGGRPYAG